MEASSTPVFDIETVDFAIKRIQDTGLTVDELIYNPDNEPYVRKIADQVNQFLGNWYTHASVEDRLWVIIYTLSNERSKQ